MDTASLLALCVLAAMLCLILSGYKPEYSMAVVIIAGCAIFLSLLEYIVPVLKELKGLAERAGTEIGGFKIAFKALGVCYITQFAADTCRDFGQSALASKAELVGKCAVLLLSVPLIENITEIALQLIGVV